MQETELRQIISETIQQSQTGLFNAVTQAFNTSLLEQERRQRENNPLTHQKYALKAIRCTPHPKMLLVDGKIVSDDKIRNKYLIPGRLYFDAPRPFIYIDCQVIDNKIIDDLKIINVETGSGAVQGQSINNQLCFFPDHPACYLGMYSDLSYFTNPSGVYQVADLRGSTAVPEDEKDPISQLIYILELVK